MENPRFGLWLGQDCPGSKGPAKDKTNNSTKSVRIQVPRAAMPLSGLFAVVITAQAQTTAVWNPAANPSGTGLWNEGANWTGAVVPDFGYKAVLNVPGAIPCVINSAATVGQLVIGDKHRQQFRTMSIAATCGVWPISRTPALAQVTQHARLPRRPQHGH